GLTPRQSPVAPAPAVAARVACPSPGEQRACRGGSASPRGAALGSALADQVGGARGPRVGGMDGVAREHQAVAGTEAELAPLGAERDLARDDPDALVVVVRVRGVVGAGVVGPLEDGEAIALEALAEGGFGGSVGAGPGDDLESHGACQRVPGRLDPASAWRSSERVRSRSFVSVANWRSMRSRSAATLRSRRSRSSPTLRSRRSRSAPTLTF